MDWFSSYIMRTRRYKRGAALTDKGSKTVQPELDLRSGRTGSIRHSGSCVSLSLIQMSVIVSQLV